MANKVVARKVRQMGKATMFFVGLAVVLALGLSVASTAPTHTTDLDGKDPAEFRSGSIGGFREEAIESPSGSEQMSSSGGSVGSAADSRSPMLGSSEQVSRREQVNSSGGSVGSETDSRSPFLH